MEIGRIVGSVVATTKSGGLDGRALRLVRPTTESDELRGEAFVAVDRVGAGVDEVVLVARGTAARLAVGAEVEVDAAIVAIIDHIDVGGETTYRKA